jgi:membrane protease YdiL (CAAX protease family)
MYILFLSLLLLGFITMAVLGILEKKKPKNAAITEKTRCKDYIQGIAILWGITFAVFVMCLIGNISLKDLGFRQISFKYNIWFTAVTLILCGLSFVYFIYQLISSLVSAKFREKANSQSAGGILPRTKKERWLFSFLALSAGICEEIIYRGFIVFLLQIIFPYMPIYIIILIVIIIFGISHTYQGFQGIIGTGILAILFLCLFLVTDSLILAMFLHFIVDFSATFLLSEKEIK